MSIATQDQDNMSFVVDPSSGLTDGFVVGDQVDVTYHQSSGQQVVENVDDLTADGSSSGSSGGGSGD